jgi:hypothetical protein
LKNYTGMRKNSAILQVFKQKKDRKQ